MEKYYKYTKKPQSKPQSKINEFGSWLQKEQFSCSKGANTPTEKVNAFENIMQEKINHFFPKKSVRKYKIDKEWMTDDLHKLRRRKSREYRKNKKSPKFIELHNQFLKMKAENSKKYIENEIEILRHSNPRQFYQRIKKVGERLGECNEKGFTIPSHAEKGLSKEEEANKIANYFSQISREFEPININRFPQRVKEKLLDKDILNNAKIIEDFEVYEKFKSRKLKRSSVPGDIPPVLKKEFYVELAAPAANIFNSITISVEYPRQ